MVVGCREAQFGGNDSEWPHFAKQKQDSTPK